MNKKRRETAVLNDGPAEAEVTARHIERNFHAPGPKASPRIRRAIGALGAGDVLMVTRLDQLARSTRDLPNTLAGVHQFQYRRWKRATAG